jgi:5-methylcytosine-specific restriction endonuclease McrA
MKDPRYPENWTAIALTKNGWRCEDCGLKCLDPALKSELPLSERKRREMSVHHSDYDPSNNSPENLAALCSSCHLKKHARCKGNISPGQLSLF